MSGIVHTTSQKYSANPKFLFLILKLLFLMKQVKHQNFFIYYSKYKSFWTTLNTN